MVGWLARALGITRKKARQAYPRTVWRLAVLFIVVSNFVEVVLVQLTNEAGKVAVLEMFGQDVFCEFLVLRPNQYCLWHAAHMRRLTSSTTKLSPSFPHRTTLSSLGFSSILRHGSAWHRRGQMAGGNVLVQLAHLQKLLARHGPKTKGKHTKSLELLEPEPAAWVESMMGGVDFCDEFW
jgi:hypothetical protein